MSSYNECIVPIGAANLRLLQYLDNFAYWRCVISYAKYRCHRRSRDLLHTVDGISYKLVFSMVPFTFEIAKFQRERYSIHRLVWTHHPCIDPDELRVKENRDVC